MPPRKSAAPALAQDWQDEASPAIISRGKAYFDSGLVKPVNKPVGERQSFIVQGSEPYTVQLHPTDLYLNSCTCPHAVTVSICKHMVAAKLFSLAPLPPSSQPQTTTPAKPKASAKDQEILANIEFLRTRTAEDLSNWLTLQCDKNPLLAQQLTQWRSQTKDLPQTPAQWKHYLTQAMPQRRGMWGRELALWVKHAMESTELLQQEVVAQPANILAAAEVALRRLFKIWETCDDSNGEAQDLYAHLQDILYASVAQQSPPASWLKNWFELIEDDPLSFWDEAKLLALAAEPLRQAYARKAAEEWASIENAAKNAPKPARRETEASWERSWRRDENRSKWRKRYLWSLQQELSTEGWLKAMQQTSNSEMEWIELVQACEKHQQPRLALQYVQQGLQLFNNSDRLQQLLLTCYRRDGWDTEAYDLAVKSLWSKPEDEARLAAVLDCAASLGKNREQEFQSLLQKCIAAAQPPYGSRQGKDMHIAIIWLLSEDHWEQALELLAQPGMVCSWESLVKKLAQRLPESHHQQSAQLLQALLDQKMAQAKSPYAAELQLVKQICARLPKTDRIDWLQSLRKSYLRKSNFVIGLDEILSKYSA